jgi:hypothetical protein
MSQEIISEPSAVMKAIQLSELEHKLMDVNLEIRRLEGVVNSAKVSQRFKDKARKKLIKWMKKQNKLTTTITEVMFLDAEVE